jgi:hypothetical protein
MNRVSVAPRAANLWGDYELTAQQNVQTTELWSNEASSKKPIHRSATIKENGEWDYGPSAIPVHSSCLVQFVWISNVPGYGRILLDVSNKAFQRIADETGLTASITSYQACYAGIFQCHPTDTDISATSDSDFYYFSYHPKLAIVWRTHRTSRTTKAMVIARQPQVDSCKAFLASDWQPWQHPMMPAYTICCLLSREIDEVQHGLKDIIRSIEVRTEHHRFKDRHEPAAAGDWGMLSAQMSGCETKLAATVRKIKVLEDVLDFIGARSDVPGQDIADQALVDTDQLLAQKLLDMRRRLKLQMVDNEYSLERARVQRTAVRPMCGKPDSH